MTVGLDGVNNPSGPAVFVVKLQEGSGSDFEDSRDVRSTSEELERSDPAEKIGSARETALSLLRAVRALPGLYAEQELRYLEANTRGLYPVMRCWILKSYKRTTRYAPAVRTAPQQKRLVVLQ